jgi:ring-1,2-phenylacetyl-CoA epoxidase subunit PaaE
MANSESYHILRIESIKEETGGFKTFTFAEGHGINYKAGQYLTFIKFIGDKEIRRSYSITSSPELNEPLSIGVKRIENGIFSRRLIDSAKPGDELICSGSGGVFTLPDDIDEYRQLFFFAAGSGITPVYSLIKTALHTHPHLGLVLIYSNPSVERTVYYGELVQLQQQFSGRLHIEFLFSNNAQLSRARLHRELIVEFLEQYLTVQKDEALFYTCGPENYMRLCTYTIEEAGISSSNIRKENFVINAVPKNLFLPPDKETHKAIITMNGRQYQVDVPYPDSILKAARSQGINLPYSCDAGHCGNCIAKCIEGNVWHSYNEVLTDRDLQNGLVLTCVGHPVGGNVRLEV